jgi:Flp pilus assembly protein TadD
MRFSYDNSADNVRNPSQPPKRVRYGLETTDEMAELWLQVLPRNAADRAKLEEDFYYYLVRHTMDFDQYLVEQNPNDAAAQVRVGTAQLHLGQAQEAFKHFQLALRADPKCQQAFYQIGFIFQRMNKPNEAQLAFEQAVQLDPQDYQAQGSLGYLYMAKGELDKAEARFKAALQANPDDEVARKNLELVARTKANSAPK